MIYLNNSLTKTVSDGLYLRLDGTNIPTSDYSWTTNLSTTGTLSASSMFTDTLDDNGAGEIDVNTDLNLGATYYLKNVYSIDVNYTETEYLQGKNGNSYIYVNSDLDLQSSYSISDASSITSASVSTNYLSAYGGTDIFLGSNIDGSSNSYSAYNMYNVTASDGTYSGSIGGYDGYGAYGYESSTGAYGGLGGGSYGVTGYGDGSSSIAGYFQDSNFNIYLGDTLGSGSGIDISGGGTSLSADGDIETSGNIGIGATGVGTGTRKLQVDGAWSVGNPQILVLDSVGTDKSRIEFRPTYDSSEGMGLGYDASSNIMEIYGVTTGNTVITIARDTGNMVMTQGGNITTTGDLAAGQGHFTSDSGTPNIALILEENSGGEQFKFGVDSDGNLNVYNSADTSPSFKILDSTAGSRFVEIDTGKVTINMLGGGGWAGVGFDFKNINGNTVGGMYGAGFTSLSNIILANGAFNGDTRAEFVNANGITKFYGASPRIEQHATTSGGVALALFNVFLDESGSVSGEQELMLLGINATAGDPSTANYIYMDVGDDDVDFITSVFKLGKAGGLGLNTGINAQPANLIEAHQYADSNGIKLFGYDDVDSSYSHTYIDSSGNANIDTTGNLIILSGQIDIGTTPVASAPRKVNIYDDGVSGDARIALHSTSGNFGAGIECTVDGDSTKRTLMSITEEGSNDYGIQWQTTNNGVVNTNLQLTGNGELLIPNDNKSLVIGNDNDVKHYYDNTDYWTTTDTTTASDWKIDCGTDKTIELQETVYKDINVGASILTLAAANRPTLATFTDETGTDTLITTYSYGVGDLSSGSFELQHDYKEGTDLVFHIHWQGITAPAGGTDNVNWELIYTLARDGQTLDAATTITSEVAFTTQYAFARTDFTAITGTNFLIGDQFLFRIRRVAASGDEYGGGSLVATAGIHYEVDTLGSRQIGTK